MSPDGPACDLLQAVGTVIDGVHSGDDGQQYLRRADIARRLLAANVLLAGLQGQSHCGMALVVFRKTDNSARNLSLVGVASGEIGRVRSTVAHRHPESLGVPHHDVGAELARCLDQQQTQEVGCHHDQQRVGFVGFGGEVFIVEDVPSVAGYWTRAPKTGVEKSNVR